MQPPTAEELLLILWRRKIWVLVPVILGAIGGFVAVKVIPSSYRASAEILIEPPKVADGLVKDITTLSVNERLEAVYKQITARDRIEALVEDFDLYPELGPDQLNEAVSMARRALVVMVGDDRSVRIEMTGGDPYKLSDAVNRVADDYVQQNSALRAVESEGTVGFMQEQLIDSRKRLSEIETTITKFKTENFMRLPDQRGPHTRALEGLMAKSESNDDALAGAEMRLALLRQGVRPLGTRVEQLSPAAALLEQRRQDLRALRRDFTDQHPDVIRLKREVAALEEEVARAPKKVVTQDAPVVDPRLAAEIAQLEFEIGDLKNDKRQIEADIARYRTYLEQIPEVEQQLLVLEREYENLEGFYGQNLKRSTEIGQAEALEKGDLRETATILERAVPETTPFSPNKPFLLTMGFALGGAAGLGLALLRENAVGGFDGPAELKRAFPGVRVLDPIPRIRVSSAGVPTAAGTEKRSA